MSEQVFTIAATWDSAAKEGTPRERRRQPDDRARGRRVPRRRERRPESRGAAPRGRLGVLRPDLGDLPREAEGPDRGAGASTASCELDKDPAGGFRVTTDRPLRRTSPRRSRESRQADVEKTLSLAEKYCIVSKAVKGSLALTVTPKPV